MSLKDDLKSIATMGIGEREEGLEREKKGIRPEIKADFRSDINAFSDKEKQTLLAMTMQSIRGSWGSPEERLGIVFYLCDNIKELPKAFLDAVRHNAYLFNGHMIDGRIFRDGDREFGMSGNLAFHVVGDDRIKQKGFHGTYDELWGLIKQDKEIMKEVYGKVLYLTDDCSWDDLK